MAEIRIEKPFPIYCVPRVWKWIEEFRNRVADDFSPKTLADFVADWERREAMGATTWAVIRDEEIGGVMMSTRLSPRLADIHCILKSSFWGGGVGTAAMRAAFTEIFAAGAQKITGTTFRTNHAVVSILYRLGGKKEGLLRGHTEVEGKPADLVVIGIQREAFNELVNRDGRTPELDRVRQFEQQHKQLVELQPERQRHKHEPAKPDAVPVGASGSAVSVHHERDAESAGDRPAVPASSK